MRKSVKIPEQVPTESTQMENIKEESNHTMESGSENSHHESASHVSCDARVKTANSEATAKPIDVTKTFIPLPEVNVSDDDDDCCEVGTPTNHFSALGHVVMTLGSDDDDNDDNDDIESDARPDFNTDAESQLSRQRRRARRNWYKKLPLVDVRTRSDPRFQKTSASAFSSTATLLADPSHLDLPPMTSVSSPEIHEVDHFCLNSSVSFGRPSFLNLPWKAKNRRRHSWICG